MGNLSCSISVGVGKGDWRVPALMFMSTIGYLQPSYEVAQCGHGSCVPSYIAIVISESFIIYNQVANMVNTYG